MASGRQFLAFCVFCCNTLSLLVIDIKDIVTHRFSLK